MSVNAPPVTGIAARSAATRVAKHSYGLRILGLVLAALAVGTVLHQRGVPAWIWALVVVDVLVWPHVAWWMMRRSAALDAMYRSCALVDAAMGGVWVALMQFNLLPSVSVVTTIAITLIMIDGGRLLVRGLALQAVVCGMVAAATGFAFAPATGTVELLASLPLLVVFPVTMGFTTHALAGRVRAQNLQLRRIGSIDGLSELLNRKHWEDAVNAALTHHCCDDAVMLLIDIDHFKQVNDQYGHTAGDEVIRQVGEIIRGSLRAGDLAGRYGGDEFCVVLCGVDLHAAAPVAERIRAGVACSLFGTPGLRCTLSIGLAHCPAGARSVRDWVKDADAALYRAKLAGRNRFVVAN